MKTVAYYRNSISKEKQKLSIEMQMQHVHEVAAKNRLLIDDEFMDRETSARKKKMEERKGMAQLIEEIKKGRVKNLIVYSRCRLARNVQQYMSLYDLLRQHKVNVIFAADFEFPMMYTAEAELIERIVAAMNQEDAEKLVQKLQDSKVTVAREGKHAGGRIPFGYRSPREDPEEDKEESDWILVGEEVKTIQNVYDLFLQKDFSSLTKFVEIVNELGLRFKDNKEWNYSNMQNVLTNPIYKGKRISHIKGEEIEKDVPHLKIVDETVWENVQKKMSKVVKRRKKSKENQNENHVFLLKELVYCDECNQVMHGKPHQLKGKTFLVYKCKKHSKVRASKDWLENTVIEHANEFFNQIIHTQFAEVIEKIYKGETKGYIEAIKQIDRELKQLEESMVQRVEHALAKEEELQLNKSMLQMLKKYEQSLFVKSELESRIFEMNEKFKTIHDWKQESSLKMIDPDMEDDQKIELLQDIISRVRVSKEKIEIIFRHPLFTGLEGREEIGLI